MEIDHVALERRPSLRMNGDDCFHLDAGSSGIAWPTDITFLEMIKHIHVNDIVSILLSISYPRDVINSK